MTDNRTFWKAFHSLTHPLSIMAILLLLFNDHWLRYAHPSWLTGKLGDFTWLVFAPFIASLLLAWIIPQRWKQHTKIVGWLSIGFIGMWFATAKTIPFVHELTTQTLYAIVGWEGQLRLDITDLLTLPALLISGYIWRQASDEKVSLKPLAYVAFGLAMLGTLASDNGPSHVDRGISQICVYEDLPFIETTDIYGSGRQYQSINGGIFWEMIGSFNSYNIETALTIENAICDDSPQGSQLTINDSLRIRWARNDSITVSKDGGKTWIVEYDLVQLHQDVREAYMKYGYEDYVHLVQNEASPVDAHYDEKSDSTIFAMSWNGVLVRDRDGNYTWATVGDYGLENLANLQKATNAIFFELWLALATTFLIFATSTLHIRRLNRSTLKTTLIIISWIGYVGILFLLLSDRISRIYLPSISSVGLVSLPILVFLGIPLSIGALWDILRNFRSVALQIALAGLGNGALFIFPFLLWTQGRIPRYDSAYVFSVFLTLLGLYATRVYLKRVLPVLEPEKMKRNAIEKDKTSESP